MRNASRFTLLIALLGIAASRCGGQDRPPFDLELRGSRLPTTRANLHVGLEETDGDVLIRNEWFPVDYGSLDVVYGDLLAAGAAYRVSLFYDSDDNNMCSPPPADRVWKIEFGPVDSAVTIDLGSIEQDASGCDGFVLSQS